MIDELWQDLRYGLRLSQLNWRYAVMVVLTLAICVGAMQRTIENQIFGVHPLDPAILCGTGTLLATVALAACLWPARRATKIDPMIALNE